MKAKVAVKINIAILLLICLMAVGCSTAGNITDSGQATSDNNSVEEQQGACGNEAVDYVGTNRTVVDLSSIPTYAGNAFVVINNNNPYFTDEELTRAATSYEYYSDLDALGRCGVCVASVGSDIMPTEERGAIGAVKPTGWHTVKYDVVDGKYLYNRCHLLGYQLTAENANEKNLMTGSRYLNVEGMLPFENMVADFVEETGNHVLYRVTPVFEGDNLVANGVLMEARSIEDNGEGILFHVFCYNVQPGVIINYANGESQLDSGLHDIGEGENASAGESTNDGQNTHGVHNTNGGQNSDIVQMVWIPQSGSKFHSSDSCSNMKNPSQVTKEDAVSRGYTPCKKCY